MNRSHRLAVIVAGLLVVGCDSGPQGGEIEFTLDGPETVGALRFAVTANEPEMIDTVTAACAGCTVYMVRSGDRDVRGVLVGDIGLGPALTVTVSNRETPDLYGASVRQVALADYSLISTSGFTLRGPPPENQ